MSKLWRWLLALVLSIAFLSVLFRIADIGAVDFSGFQPTNFLIISVAYAAGLIGRASLIRMTVSGGLKISLWDWMGLTGRHQFLFTLAPSGLGDLGFPGLAERVTGLGGDKTVPALLAVRTRDALILIAAALAGFGQFSGFPELFLILAILVLATQFMVPFAPRLMPNSWRMHRLCPPFLRARDQNNDQAQAQANIFRSIFLPAIVSIGIWSLSLFAIFMAFQAVSLSLSLLDLLLVLAVLNFVGAIGLTVGGLGVSEAGLAGAMILLGYEPMAAAATALSVRPLLLAGNLSAAAILYVPHRFKGSTKT